MATFMFVTSTGMVPSGTGTATGQTTTLILITRLRSQLSSFLLYLLMEEFCFISCPFQSPSIRPISLIFSEIVKYFLVSSDFVSQRISRKILIASFFLIASLIYGCFSLSTKKRPKISPQLFRLANCRFLNLRYNDVLQVKIYNNHAKANMNL